MKKSLESAIIKHIKALFVIDDIGKNIERDRMKSYENYTNWPCISI